jgi:hypothetical protein
MPRDGRSKRAALAAQDLEKLRLAAELFCSDPRADSPTEAIRAALALKGYRGKALLTEARRLGRRLSNLSGEQAPDIEILRGSCGRPRRSPVLVGADPPRWPFRHVMDPSWSGEEVAQFWLGMLLPDGRQGGNADAVRAFAREQGEYQEMILGRRAVYEPVLREIREMERTRQAKKCTARGRN